MFDYKSYWNNRYTNGNSGIGSYGKSAQLKADYVNNIIKNYNIDTLNDYGHGDCNQLKYIQGFKRYVGYDISSNIRKKCIQELSNESIFFIDSIDKFEFSDLSISLDVLYHIVDYNDFTRYINHLFDNTNYVIIYSMDTENDIKSDNHVFSRKFTDYIEKNIKNFTLCDITDGINENIKFYFYKKNEL